MKVIRRYLAAAGLVAFVAFLVGCGGGSNKVTNPPPVPPSADEELAAPPNCHGGKQAVAPAEDNGDVNP